MKALRLNDEAENKCPQGHTIIGIKMFTDDELKELSGLLIQQGLTNEAQQKEVLEYFYTLGKIIYKINVGCYEKEN